MLGVRRWRELVTDREKWRGIFDRPKPTAGCSANGRRSSSLARSELLMALLNVTINEDMFVDWDSSRCSDSIQVGRSRDQIPEGEGEIFPTRPDRPCDPPCLLYNGYWLSFQGLKRLARGADHPPPFSAVVKKE
jgi:hypothetical protein